MAALRILLSAAFLVALGAAPARAAPPTRLNVVVVLDVSLSMRDNDPDYLARLAARLLSDLTDARDKVTLVSFGSGAKKILSAGGDAHDALQKALDGVVPADKCTDYASGLGAAAAELSGPQPAGERRLVVFLTDGEYHPAKDPAEGCTPATRFENPKLADEDRARFEKGVLDAASRLSAAHAKVFVVGLGGAFDKAKRSRALLDEVAKRTGGRFLAATSADRVPELFTDVFATLVGAPVFKPAPAGVVSIDVPPDAEQLHLVARVDDPSGGVEVTRGGTKLPFGKPANQVSGPTLRLERGKRPRGYAVVWLGKPDPGVIELRPTSSKGPLAVWAIADVGTSLRIEKLPAVVPETASLSGLVALRSGQGKPVARDPSYLGKVTFHVELAGSPPRALPAAGRETAAFDFGKLAPRAAPYVLSARAEHEEGFLQVEPVKLEVRVIHQIPLAVELTPLAFDTMAEPGVVARVTARVVAPAKLPADVRLDLVLPEDARKDLRVEPPTLAFGPERREQVLSFSFAEPESLRGTDRRYRGELAAVVSAEQQGLVSAGVRWTAPVDGTLRAWTLGRWLREYRWQLGLGLGVLWLLLWLLGRALAAKFPPKARIHHMEVGEPFESDSLIKRHARRGAYRSARFRFPLGKKAKPLVSFVATGSGFEVRPEGAAVTELGIEPATEKRQPFRGSWEQRYRLGDRYEVWLTRS